jgi:hypothetical protein
LPSAHPARLAAALVALLCACAPEPFTDPVASPSVTPDEAARTDVAPTPDAVTEASLWREATTLDHLARRSTPPFRARLASSASRAPRTERFTSWYGDDEGDLGRFNDERLILASDHPGAITHLWSANPSGRLRVYLDDDARPRIDVDLAQLLAGAVAPFVAPFAHVTAEGRNLLWPITWSRRARVTLTAPRIYYLVDYREYDDDTRVEAFGAAADAAAAVRARSEAARVLRGLSRASDAPGARLTLRPGDAPITVAAPAGGGVVRALRLAPSTLDGDALRTTALHVAFDGEPCVDVPLSALLLRPPGELPARALPMERDGDAVIVRFPMPMRREVTLSLETLGARRVEVEASLDVEARPFDDDAMHFHAAFLGRLRNDAALRPTDLRLLAVRGAGRYVGVVLDVANGDPQWWGEGDHRFTVDGDDGRAHRGTGTEDYFHLAWCSTERFTAAFNGQLRANGPAPTGFATLYRFHVLDAVPFERAFTFDLEAVLWGTTVRVAPPRPHRRDVLLRLAWRRDRARRARRRVGRTPHPAARRRARPPGHLRVPMRVCHPHARPSALIRLAQSCEARASVGMLAFYVATRLVADSDSRGMQQRLGRDVPDQQHAHLRELRPRLRRAVLLRVSQRRSPGEIHTGGGAQLAHRRLCSGGARPRQ